MSAVGFRLKPTMDHTYSISLCTVEPEQSDSASLL